jgi:protein phosphatase
MSEPERIIEVPGLALVVLVGSSGSGKSTFAARHFLRTEVVSSDTCRGIVSDDETSLAATNDAFALLEFIVATRLRVGHLTVVDATSVRREDRAKLIQIAREHHVLSVAVVFDISESVCLDRNAARPERDFGPHVVRKHVRELRRGLRGMRKEGFTAVHVLSSAEEIDSAVIRRRPSWNDRRDHHGPFDIIGDVHGCADELEELLARLGYAREGESSAFRHPARRTAVFLGDLVDRGPRVLDTIAIVRRMVEAESALCVPGNHDQKLVRKLRGRDVQITYGLAESLAEINALPDTAREGASAEIAGFLDGLVSHYVLDEGRLVVAHAGLKQEMHGRQSAKVRDFALYGETTGETDEFGLPVRWDWARDYRGEAKVVYGHTPVPEPEWLNRTINLDTGCVFGGSLTALRYPENELVSVPARGVYAEPARPFLIDGGDTPAQTAQHQADELLDIDDVIGKRFIQTRLHRGIVIREENAITALEVMSRFAIDPRWLIYLPPTVSPSATSAEEGLLEHPAEAFTYYREEGIAQVMCEEKHMGSRAVVVVGRDAVALGARFGVETGSPGACFTRTGRAFFDDPDIEREFLDGVREACETAGLFDRLETDWMLLDGELMPWSAKAQQLLEDQYAAVGVAARVGLGMSLAVAEQVAGEDGGSELVARLSSRLADADGFVEAYRRYCWPVRSIADLRFAPFHLLASEGTAHTDKNHAWHMGALGSLAGEGLIAPTAHLVVDTTDPESVAEGVAWWFDLTQRGGEGMVVKPMDFVARGRRGLVQPALKCRGREYLRIIYGPEYTDPENLERLRSRGLGRKRSLASREFSLGVEAIERFVRGEPLRRVHECCFGVLALESEPVDPRL